jgi:hypothetical protein
MYPNFYSQEKEKREGAVVYADDDVRKYKTTRGAFDRRHRTGILSELFAPSLVCRLRLVLSPGAAPAGGPGSRQVHATGQTRNPGHCRARTPHTRGATIAPPPATAFPLACDEEVAKASMRFSHQRSV